MEIIGLVIAFVVIVSLVMKRVNLGISMLIGSTIIGITSPNIGLTKFFPVLAQGMFNSTTFELVMVIIMIGIIAKLMEKTGLVDQMITSLSILFKRFQPILVVVPSVMGVLAIPGGAMLSAPMVSSIARDLNLKPEKKMVINLLFRHIWYFIFPFTPGLILTAHLIGYDIFFLIKHLFPLTLALGITGYLTLFRGLKNPPVQVYSWVEKRAALKNVLLALAPMLIGIILPFISPISFWLALFIGIVFLLIYKWREIDLPMLKKSLEWKLSLGILGIMVFREFINQLAALEELANGIITAGLPVWVLAVILPGLVGFLTGSTSGAIGITFPLLAPLIGGLQPEMSYIVLMFGTAFFSYYLSPLHFCLILTAEYFDVSLKATYKEIFIPTLAGILMMVILFLLY